MLSSASSATIKRPPIRHSLARLWKMLTDPPAALEQPDDQRRARLLAAALLLLTGLDSVLVVVTYLYNQHLFLILGVITFVTMATAYVLSRTVYYTIGAAIVLVDITLMPLAAVLGDPSQVYVLAYLANSILFSVLFFSGRVTMLLAVSELAALALLGFVKPEIDPLHLLILGVFIITGSTLVITFNVLRRQDQLQREAQARAVADSELRYRLIAENATDWICRHKLDGTYLYTSPACRELLGYEPEELIGQSPYNYYHPDDTLIVRASHDNLLTNDEADVMVYRFRRKDGSYIWFESSGKVIRDPVTGTPWEIITVSRDVTERKMVEDVLYDSEARFRAAAEGSQDAFFLVQSERDESGNIVDFMFVDLNERGAELVGMTYDQMIGQRLCELLPIYRTGGFFEKFVRVVETGFPLEEEFPINAPEFRAEWLHHQAVQVGDGVAITTRNITERKRAEEDIRQSNLRLEASRDTLQRLIQQMPIGVQVFNTNGLCTDCNRAYMEIFGVDSRDQVIGKFDIYKHVRPDPFDLVGSFKRAAAGEIVHLKDVELDFDVADRRFASRTGRLVLGVTFCPIYDEHRNIVSVIALNQDITERRRAEENLRQTNLRLEASRDTLQRLIEQMPIGIQVFDANGLCTDVNQAHMAIFGIASREQVVGKFNIQTDAMAEKVGTQAGFRRALAGEVAHVGEVEFDFSEADPRYTATTGRHFLSVSFFPIYDENRHIVSVVALNQDVTERKLAEESLQRLTDELLQQKNMLNAVLSTTPDQLAIFDREGRYLYINPPGLATIGVDMADVQNKTWRELGAPPTMGERFDREREQVFTTGQPISSAHVFPSVNGPRDFEYTFSPVFDSEGKVVFMVSTTRDVTEQRQAEQERFALAVERERVKMLQHLISDTSHDLKTPLATLNTSLYLLKKTISDPERREHYTKILQAQVNNLTKILEDMDSMSRLDGEIFVYETVDVNELLRQIVTGHETLASKKNQRLRFSPADSIPPLSADATKLRRAVSNLVTNALNYTHDGGEIEVRIFRRDDNVVIEVRDNGIGIPQAELELIFERFYRAEETRETYSSGSGLGLAISKKIVEAHGGTIEVESSVGVGSSFSIVLPLTPNKGR